MKEPIWLTVEDVELYHEILLSRNGGMGGIRDRACLESAVSRPKNLHLYERNDLPGLAACYAHAIASNHPFFDGNKRAAFAAAAVFLKINSVDLTLSEEHATALIIALAANTVTQDELADAFRKHSKTRET